MKAMNRRDFLRVTSAGAGAMAFGGGLKPARAGVNDTIRLAVIGVRGRGQAHIAGFEQLPGVEVAALCDVDQHILGERAEALEKETNRKIVRYGNMRELFDDKRIDAVSIATPNHWHSLAGIWAMQAGKDVYVEKPLSHNVWEGRQLVKAARKYKRMCQHGVQGRSSPAICEGIAKLHEGVIGDVYMARGVCYRRRPSIGKVDGPQPVPEYIDYDQWLGPAPKKPLMRKQLHYDWHWQWDYGNGDIGNQGVHEMDLARWGLVVGLPSKIQSTGGMFLFDADKQIPNVQTTAYYYPESNKLLVFEVRPWFTNDEAGFTAGGHSNTGVLFFGSEGYMALWYFKYATFLGDKHEPGPSAEGAGSEWSTFIAGVRSRKEEDLGNTVEDGHLTSTLCHLGHVSYRLDRVIRFDPKTERCIGDEEANKMLTRNYRPPYVVPGQV